MSALWNDETSTRDRDRVAPYAEVRETHSAVVFLVGDRAFKLKKPVDLGFLDFSTPTKRLRASQRELVLNRRMAPDVYLGISDLNDVDGKPLEHLVVMRRMPADRRLAYLVRTHTWPQADLDDLARTVADFHATAERSDEIGRSGDRDAVADRWESNFTEARPWVGSLLDADTYGEVCSMARRYLEGRQQLFDERRRQGAIVDGHGDLLAEDIFMLADGPRILDCLDFDDRLRHLDRIDDVACLVMDLEHLGSKAAGDAFLDAYLRASGDDPPDSLVHHYIAYRAFMRAKVACLPGAAGQATLLPSSLLDLAHRHLEDGRVRLILVGGAPGTGKTTAATRLARVLPADLLSSDPVRKELAGIAPDVGAADAFEAGIYTPERTEDTYETLLGRAGELLARGRSVILDASWAQARHREAAARLAHDTVADLCQFRCVLPECVADGRIRTRGPSSSDADADIAAAVRARFEAWPEAVAVDTGGPLDAVMSQLLHRLQPWRAARPARPRMVPD